MRRTRPILVLVLTALLLPLISFADEAVRLRHVLSLYTDEKGNGLVQPEGVACGEDRLVVADSGNGRLVLYSLVSGDPKGGREIKIPQILYPVRVRIGSKGDLYVLDGRQRKVALLTGEGVFTRYIEPSGQPGNSPIIPADIALDDSDNLYVLDVLAGRVLVLAPDGKFQRQVGFPKEFGFFTGLVVDGKGTVYAIDSVTATVYTNAKAAAVFAPLTASLKENLKFPISAAFDRNNLLYVADQNSGGIVMLRQDGTVLNRQLNLGWKEGFLRSPAEICLDKAGDLFVADRDNSRVQEFSPLR